MLSRALIAVFAATILTACTQAPSIQATDKLKPCTGDDAPADAYCGSLKVYENRATKQGRQIDLNIMVLPALSNDPKPDPLFFLAGGPGQAATKLAPTVREIFRRVQNDRDLVLVDQRGTGKSNGLECKQDDETDPLKDAIEAPEQALARLKTCMSKYDADLTQYTTDIAMDDLDDVRAFLGYDKINLYGGSYGTRAGLVYMRRHGDHVRASIIDGVAPTFMRLPLYFPRDSQRAFDQLVADCAADATCNAKYPDLGNRMKALLERLEKNPPTVTLTHPRTGETRPVKIEARMLANVVVFALYVPTIATLVPDIVADGERNDFQSLFALGTLGDGGDGSGMAIGMQLSVICAEDAPRNTDAELEKEASATLFGKYEMQLTAACKFWPRGNVDAAFYEPVQSDIPTLVMSGAIDPITPPTWGEQAARTLTHSRHVVIPGTGHTAGSTGCGQRIMRDFIDKGSTDALDVSCVDRVKRPAFFVTPAGPDPTRTSGSAK